MLGTTFYIYIHPFSKRFSYREIYRQIYTFVLLHVRPCAFFTCYCPTCEKLVSTINFFVVGFFVPIRHDVLSFFFQKKTCALRYKFAMENYIADFGNEENIPRSSRSASYTASPNWQAKWSVLKNALSRGVLKRNCKLT